MKTSVRHKLARKRHRAVGHEPATCVTGISPRVQCVLDSMKVLSDFALFYRLGSPIPEPIQEHARIVADYLGHPLPEQWLWEWLNGLWRE